MGHKRQFVLGKIYYVLTINMPWMCVAAPWISKLLVQKCFRQSGISAPRDFTRVMQKIQMLRGNL